MKSFIFISYSRSDRKLVGPVTELLRAALDGLTSDAGRELVFLDLDGIPPGRRWRNEIWDAIGRAEKVFLFWCGHASKSENVREEYTQAISRGKQLVPVILDDTPLPREVAPYQGIDLRTAFSHRKFLGRREHVGPDVDVEKFVGEYARAAFLVRQFAPVLEADADAMLSNISGEPRHKEPPRDDVPPLVETRDEEPRVGRLVRVLGVAFGLAVTVGITIGMGILRTPGEVARQLPNAWLFLGVWLLGGVYALLGAFSVAELGTMLPRSGGFYVFARRALGEYPGFVVGWSDWLSTCGTVAAVALVIGEYAGLLAPPLAGRPLLVASCVAVAFALLQWRGVIWGGRSQELTSLLKALAFAALIAACFASGGRQEAHAAAGDAAGALGPVAPAGVGLLTAAVLALQGVIYTYDGWYSTVYFGEEVRDPASSVPRAMVGSVLLVILIYLLFNLALLYVLPFERLAGHKLAAGAAAEAVFGPRGATVIAAVAVVSLLASVNGNTLTAPRVLYALSRDGLFWRVASRVNRGGTPTVSLALSTAVAVLMIVFSGAFQRLLAGLAFFFVTDLALVFLSVFVLRRREPLGKRPYRAWGYPFTTALALAGSVAFLVGAVLSDTENSLYALALLAASAPVYLVLRLVRGARGRREVVR